MERRTSGCCGGMVRHHIPVEVMVGVSAGAIISAYYAGVGLSVNEMIDLAPVFRGRHILMHGLTLRAHASIQPFLRRFCGIIPQRLRAAEVGRRFKTSLHHGVRRLGIVCHDIICHRPCYLFTAESHGVRLSDVARASAAVPGVLPAKTDDGRGPRLS